MKKYWLVLIVIFLIGCARPYEQYYHDLTQGEDISQAIITAEEPKVLRGTDPKEDELRMLEEGYVMLGYSSFNGPKINENQALAKAKELKASVIILYSKYTETRSGIQPVTIPDIKTSNSTAQSTVFGSAYGSGGYASGTATAFGTGSTTTYGTKTIYQPYSVDRFEQGATYWVKMKPPILGLLTLDIPSDLRQKIGSNKGAFVAGVIKESPAFSADILRGDIVKSINNIDILDSKDYVESNKRNAGKKVKIKLLRDGKEVIKEVKLNPPPGS